MGLRELEPETAVGVWSLMFFVWIPLWSWQWRHRFSQENGLSSTQLFSLSTCPLAPYKGWTQNSLGNFEKVAWGVETQQPRPMTRPSMPRGLPPGHRPNQKNSNLILCGNVTTVGTHSKRFLYNHGMGYTAMGFVEHHRSSNNILEAHNGYKDLGLKSWWLGRHHR